MRAYSSGATTGDNTKSSRARLGIQPGQAGHLDAEQNRNVGQRADLTHAPDGGAAHLQVRPGVDHDHRRPLQLDVLGQLIDVVADGHHLAAEIAERRRGRVGLRRRRRGVGGHDEGPHVARTLSVPPRRSNSNAAALPPANIKIMFRGQGSAGAPESG